MLKKQKVFCCKELLIVKQRLSALEGQSWIDQKIRANASFDSYFLDNKRNPCKNKQNLLSYLRHYIVKCTPKVL